MSKEPSTFNASEEPFSGSLEEARSSKQVDFESNVYRQIERVMYFQSKVRLSDNTPSGYASLDAYVQAVDAFWNLLEFRIDSPEYKTKLFELRDKLYVVANTPQGRKDRYLTATKLFRKVVEYNDDLLEGPMHMRGKA